MKGIADAADVWPGRAAGVADPLGKGLRATGDVKLTTVISLLTTIGIRLVFSILFGITWNLGVIGIACAMCLDWVRGLSPVYTIAGDTVSWNHSAEGYRLLT